MISSQTGNINLNQFQITELNILIFPMNNLPVISICQVQVIFVSHFYLYPTISIQLHLMTWRRASINLIQKAVSLNLSLVDFPHGFLWMFGLYILAFRIATQLIGKQMKKILVRFSHQRLDWHWCVRKKQSGQRQFIVLKKHKITQKENTFTIAVKTKPVCSFHNSY